MAPVPAYTTRPKGDDTAKTHLLKECADVFNGIGCFKGEYHIALDSTVPPVVHCPCEVPVAPREPIKEEFDTLIKFGTIVKVDCPIEWCELVCMCH